MSKSRKKLTFEERLVLDQRYKDGAEVDTIAAEMNRDRSTIYKELHRGFTGLMDANGKPGYSAETAQAYAYAARMRTGRRKKVTV